MAKRVDEIDTKDKKVILRAVLNVPVKNGAITDESRIDAFLPTVKHLLEQNARVVIVGFMGRPQGERLPEMSVRIVAEALSAKLGKHVEFVEDFTQESDAARVKAGQNGEIFMLENIRFYPEEESKDEGVRQEFAKKLAEFGEVYVNDAFPDYRPQASTFELAKIVPTKAIGFNFAEEIAALDKLMSSPERPFVAVLGGAKLSEKIDILNTLGEKADKIIIGGAMAYTLLQKQGHKVGSSLVEADKLGVAGEILQKYGEKLVLPIDHLGAASFSESEMPQEINGVDIPDGMWGLDIGPLTIESYLKELDEAKTILWNGPMGVFEWQNYAEGTRAVGGKVADQAAFTVVGGGDTISAVNEFELEYGVDHICTGGGAMLEYIAKGTLDTLKALDN